VHTARVSVREHASILRERLARSGRSTFRALTQDCQHTVEIVARFLALLELYRENAVTFDQVSPLGELWVRWTGGADGSEPSEGQDVDEEYG
jgi:segregation and condensation protein A